MFFKGASSKTVPYWLYLLMLFPGVVVASMTISYDGDFRKLVAFNISGPVCLGVSALYCYYKKIKREDFQRVLLMMLMPLVAQMMYLYFYTPSMDDVRISLSGNYAATGGFGPNQISSVLGLGVFLLCTRLFSIRDRLINTIDMLLLIMMGYRALITFSRGGVLTAIVCVVCFNLFITSKMPNELKVPIFEYLLWEHYFLWYGSFHP